MNAGRGRGISGRPPPYSPPSARAPHRGGNFIRGTFFVYMGQNLKTMAIENRLTLACERL